MFRMTLGSLMRGKLIVIDGGDGSGKTTQVSLLKAWFEKTKNPAYFIKFPRYETFYGKIVAQFLRGEFGSLQDVSPYLASLPYALDRMDAREEMEKQLSEGKHIVCDRYVTSSIAHHSAKIETVDEQKVYKEWVEALEYDHHRMPRPDLVISLYVPWQIGLKLTWKIEKNRAYIDRADIHERDYEYRQTVEAMYRHLAKTEKNWIEINCVDEKGTLLSSQEIHKKIVRVV
ncbi:dTMP kinase [Candidatus Roizmanbacteria bacterium]|nr:dTMP kinase [Candidatus Roizmanbacteria bacterium]